ncbi:MAG: hypothetical protein RLZZ70_226, partial [Candidatus Parcubacteria bacterium]
MYQDTTVSSEEKVVTSATNSLSRTVLAIGLSLVLASGAFFSGLHLGGTSPRAALSLFAGD